MQQPIGTEMELGSTLLESGRLPRHHDNPQKIGLNDFDLDLYGGFDSLVGAEKKLFLNMNFIKQIKNFKFLFNSFEFKHF